MKTPVITELTGNNRIAALCRKDWLRLWRVKYFTAFRAFILPVAFVIFMSNAKYFFVTYQKYGVTDSPFDVADMSSLIKSSQILVWYGNTTAVQSPVVQDIMRRAFSGIDPSQVQFVSDPETVNSVCQQTLAGWSNCYGGIQWNSIDVENQIYNYTIQSNPGMSKIRINDGSVSDVDHYVLPLQWAMDNAIVGGFDQKTKCMPYTAHTQTWYNQQTNFTYMKIMAGWVAPIFFLGMIGVIYHMAGYISGEREDGISSLLSCMGISSFQRMLCYHITFSSVYLPGWIAIAIVMRAVLFTYANFIILLVFQIITGLAFVSYSLCLGSLFRASQLAGIVSAVACVFLALLVTVITQTTHQFDPAVTLTLTFLFPPANYVYYLSLSAKFQRDMFAINLFNSAPDTSNDPLIVMLWAAFLHIFVFFLIAVWMDGYLYGLPGASTTGSGQYESSVLLESVNKNFKQAHKDDEARPSLIGNPFKRNKVTIHAVKNLSFAVKPGQVVCLLGANGSGKTTTLEMIAGLQTPSSGSVALQERSLIGICPQRNVLWDKLTTREHVEIWCSLRSPKKSVSELDTESNDLLANCDLGTRGDVFSKDLSGGQKRKLQLAIMFSGGTNVCCIDEVSSGLDPVSRRKIWDILLSKQTPHVSMILTTHFLDEADILSDNVLILSKGVLKAEGIPTVLKNNLGGGYKIHLMDGKVINVKRQDVARVAHKYEQRGIKFRIAGPELEDVFLDVAKNDHAGELDVNVNSLQYQPPLSHTPSNRELDLKGKVPWIVQQTMVMFFKRLQIFKRNPWAELAFVFIPIIVCAACLRFVAKFNGGGCIPSNLLSVKVYFPADLVNMTMPISSNMFGSNNQTIVPSSAINKWMLNFASLITPFYTEAKLETVVKSGAFSVTSLDSFSSFIHSSPANIRPGGAYDNVIAYLLDDVQNQNYGADNAVGMMNLANNLRTNVTLVTNWSPFQVPWSSSTDDSLQFVIYFGLAMCICPAFALLYPTFERLSKVRAMQYSNGLRAAPLWLAYSLFDFILCLIIAIAVAGMVAGANSAMASGLFFVCILLYLLASCLLSFVFSLFVNSQLAGFAFAAAYQAVFFLIWFIAQIAIQAYVSAEYLTVAQSTAHFITSICSPSCLLLRTFWVLFNLFGVLCAGRKQITYMGNIIAYGSPILYLTLQIIGLFAVLLWWDSGKGRTELSAIVKKRLFKSRKKRPESRQESTLSTLADKQSSKVSYTTAVSPIYNEKDRQAMSVDNMDETCRVEEGLASGNSRYGLAISHVSRTFKVGKTKQHMVAVDDVTFGVEHGECFALLGPNGAGKTTTFNMIRGEVVPTSGDIFVGAEGDSIVHNLSAARAKLGVCPQFDAMDKMTVYETLNFYARLRDLKDPKEHVDRIIEAVGVGRFRHRMASKLSGGNKRKLSLAVALIGNPEVLLLDEPSSGMDAFAKRIMWKTLSRVSEGRAIVLTTHSMEEADALANRAGILSKKLLAVGDTDYLRTKYSNYFLVYLVCSSAPHTTQREMIEVVYNLQERLPGCRIKNRFYQGQITLSVPMGGSVASLFDILERSSEELGVESYAVSPPALQEVFLTIVNKEEEDPSSEGQSYAASSSQV